MPPVRPKTLPAAAALLSLPVFALSANTLPAALLRAAPDLGVSPERLAVAASIQFLAFFAATLAGGVLCDRLGKKRVLQAACALLATGAAAWTGVRSMRGACAAGVLMGAGGGVIESMSSALLTDLFPRRRKLFLNLSQVLYGVGAVGGPAAMAVLLPRGVSWRPFFGGVALLALGVFVLYTVSSIPAPQPDERIRARDVAGLVREPSFVVACLALFFYVLAESCVAVYANLFLREYRGAPESWAISSLSLVWLAMTAGRVLCAMIPEQASYEKILTALFAASGLALAAQGLVRAWPASLALFTLEGFLMAGTWPLLVARSAARHPTHTGTAVGLTVAAGALGVVAAPPFMNAALALCPSLAFVAASLPLLAGALLVSLLSRR